MRYFYAPKKELSCAACTRSLFYERHLFVSCQIIDDAGKAIDGEMPEEEKPEPEVPPPDFINCCKAVR